MELSPCSRVSKNRTFGNYSGYSAYSNHAEIPKGSTMQRDRGRKRDRWGYPQFPRCALRDRTKRRRYKKALWKATRYHVNPGTVSAEGRSTAFFIRLHFLSDMVQAVRFFFLNPFAQGIGKLFVILEFPCSRETFFYKNLVSRDFYVIFKTLR